MNPRIFVGSSAEALPIANEIHSALVRDAEVTVWDQDVFGLSSITIDSLEKALNNNDYGIFVLAPNDITKIRSKTYATARDNVVFELGLFMGKLGRNRVFFVIPDTARNFHLPSDLHGVVAGYYEANRGDENLRAAVSPFCNQVRKALKGFANEAPNLGIISCKFFKDFADDFDRLFKSSNELTTFFIHSRSWRENHHDKIKEFLSIKGNKYTAFLPDFLDKQLMQTIQANFEDGAYIPTMIKESYNYFLLLQKEFKNCKIKVYKHYPSYSFYKFGSTAIVAMYSTTPTKKNVPTFLLKQGGGFWNFLSTDIKTLEKGKQPSIKHLQTLKK